jgi:hydroxymethylpyrimidine/phosphomethylpyrimidine kinase
MKKVALTVAGSDPTGGAGLQMDLKVFKHFGLHGMAVPAALTVQSTECVDDAEEVGEDILRRQLGFLLADIKPDTTKTGMLYTIYAVETVAEMVKRHLLKNLVIDPVAVSSSGTSLEKEGVLDAIRESLFPLARVITPNLYEAALFTGESMETDESVEDAARKLFDMGPEAVIITGGHLEGKTEDLFFDGQEFQRLTGEDVPGEFHGTGCAYSSAIASGLALGDAPLEAARRAKSFIEGAIKRSFRPGRGMNILDV